MLQKSFGFEVWVIELSSRDEKRNILLCMSLLDFWAYKPSVLFSVLPKKQLFRFRRPRGRFSLLQGVSVHKDKFKIMITVGLSYIRKHSWWLACSPIFSIWVSSKKIPKSYIGWPQQPPTEKVPNISKKLDFWWSIPQKGTSIGHFGAKNDPSIRNRKFFDEIGL